VNVGKAALVASEHADAAQKDAREAIFRVQRALAGYVSYLAACDMNAAFSEYVLYEPMLRVLTAQRFDVETEVALPRPARSRGDAKRLDFKACRDGLALVIEVKWVRRNGIRVDADVEKLRSYLGDNHQAVALLCIFGTKSNLSRLRLERLITEFRDPVYADFSRTRYGCRVFRVFPSAKAAPPASR
jgi:hypothetical protein